MNVNTLINLTPHTINLVSAANAWSFPPSGQIARCTVERVRVSNIWLGEPGDPTTQDIVPVNTVRYGDIEGLPAPRIGVAYIVSSLVASALHGSRPDVLVPDDTIRDDQGRIVGCQAFARI